MLIEKLLGVLSGVTLAAFVGYVVMLSLWPRREAHTETADGL